MDKKYYFMSGLPRSGSTMLSAVLNQHPEIYASPQTELLSMLYRMNESVFYSESYNAGIRVDGHENVLNKLADSFYYDVEKPIIIDKNRTWGTPYNVNNLAKYLSDTPKFIVTLRPILEILASFTNLARQSPDNNLDNDMYNSEFWPSFYRSQEDARCDWMMRPGGEIDQAIFSIANLKQNHSDKVHVIWYQDLIKHPQIAMNKIYDFLGMEQYHHDFDNILPVDVEDDLAGYGFKDLHKIKPKITPSTTKPEEVLSEYVIQKYKNAIDFILE
jgi:sulfotransferase